MWLQRHPPRIARAVRERSTPRPPLESTYAAMSRAADVPTRRARVPPPRGTDVATLRRGTDDNNPPDDEEPGMYPAASRGDQGVVHTFVRLCVVGAIILVVLGIAPSAGLAQGLRVGFRYTSAQGVQLNSVVESGGLVIAGGAIRRPRDSRVDAYDAYAVALSATGRKQWSARLKGSRVDTVTDVTATPDGGAWLLGFTTSPDFPATITLGASATARAGQRKMFLSRVSSRGTLVRTTLLPDVGQVETASTFLEHDSTGAAIVVLYVYDPGPGRELSAPIGLQPDPQGGYDTYVLKIAADGSPAWQTYLGGTRQDLPNQVTVDHDDNVVIAGDTLSPNYPLVGSPQATNHGRADAYLSVLDAQGTQLVGSAVLGGAGFDFFYGLATEPNGRLLLSGHSNNATVPLPDGRTFRGRDFVAEFDATAHQLLSIRKIPYGGTLVKDPRGQVYDVRIGRTLGTLFAPLTLTPIGPGGQVARAQSIKGIETNEATGGHNGIYAAGCPASGCGRTVIVKLVRS